MATKSPLANQGALTDYIADRLANTSGAAEGSTLLPRQRGQGRIPIVTGLRVTQVNNYLGGSEFTIVWNNPQTSASLITGYNVYVTGALSDNQSPALLATVDASPAKVRVVGSQASVLTFYVQTVLSSGATSALDNSPTCTAQVAAPVIQTSDIRVSADSIVPGGANQIIGTNPAGTAGEWKTLSGTANQITVTLGSGSINLSLASQLAFQTLALSSTSQSSNYTIPNTISTLFISCAGSSNTVTMPAAPVANQICIIKRTDSAAGNTCTLQGNTGQSVETTALNTAGSVVCIYDQPNAAWRSVAKF